MDSNYHLSNLKSSTTSLYHVEGIIHILDMSFHTLSVVIVIAGIPTVYKVM